MFTPVPVNASDRDRIGESWNDITSPSLRFTQSCRKKEKKLWKLKKKISVSTKWKKILPNLAQWDIKIYSGPKHFWGYRHFNIVLRHSSGWNLVHVKNKPVVFRHLVDMWVIHLWLCPLWINHISPRWLKINLTKTYSFWYFSTNN